MKNLYNYIILGALILFGLSSCETDIEQKTVDSPINATASVLTSQGHSTIVPSKDNLNDFAQVYYWTRSILGDPTIAVTYTMLVDTTDQFTSPVQHGLGTNGLSITLTNKQLNDWSLRFTENKDDLKPINLFIKIAGSVLTQNSNLVFPTDSVYSNFLTVNVTPFVATTGREALFMVGNMFGVNEWNNASTQFPMFRTEPNGVDTYIGRFKAGAGMKLFPNGGLGDWSKAYGTDGNGVLKLDGQDIKGFSTERYYKLTANIADLTYSIEPYDVTGKPVYNQIGLVGDFNGWGADVMLTQTSYDPHIWSADNVQLEAGAAKFRADADWATSWGGITFPYGGASDDNIPVTAGKYYILFNDLTGEYVFYAK